MNKLIIAFTLIIAFLSNEQSVAQNKSSVKMETIDESGSNYSETRNVFKLNPLLFFRGDVPIYYEKSINDKIAVEAGVGFTLSDYFNYYYLSDDYEYEENNGLGYSFRLGLRYYASDYSYMQEGFYFAVNVRYQAYRADFKSIENVVYSENNNSSNLDFRLHVGYLHMYEENFFFEPYIAFGVRNGKYMEINYNSISDDYTTRKTTSINPIFSIGIKLGISF